MMASRMQKKVRWYQWLNPFFYIEMIVLAHIQKALQQVYQNVTEKIQEDIKRGKL